MAIVDYATLQTSIGSWLHRVDLTALIPDFITLAETRMNGDIDSHSQDARATLTCVPGATLAARLVPLPSDFLGMKRLANVTSDPVTVLEYRSPDQLMEDNYYVFQAGKPTKFTVIGSNIELSPPPDSAYSLELVYQQRIPALTNSNTTNWVLNLSPNTYLFGALLCSIPFTQDEERAKLFETLYQDSVGNINSTDWYSGSTMRVKSR